MDLLFCFVKASLCLISLKTVVSAPGWCLVPLSGLRRLSPSAGFLLSQVISSLSLLSHWPHVPTTGPSPPPETAGTCCLQRQRGAGSVQVSEVESARELSGAQWSSVEHGGKSFIFGANRSFVASFKSCRMK